MKPRLVVAPATSRAALFLLLPLLLLTLAGCGDDIETTYGQRSAPDGPWSVNGTAVLAEMFEHAGHQVGSRRMLTPRLYEKADCIVWFPDSFDAPSPEVTRWLEDWLLGGPDRTLIYVGRDFDAAITYWETILPGAPPKQAAEIKRRLAEAKANFRAARSSAPADAECVFFHLKGRPPLRRVKSLDGDPKWLDGVDPAKADIQISGRLKPCRDAYDVLSSAEDSVVSIDPSYDRQVIMVANGSFLLNLPLVNHEHRKLAGRLIDQIGPAPQYVVFLESGPAGPEIRDEEPPLNVPTGMDFFHEYPANWILLQMSIVGILFCLWRLPIFGKPVTPQPDASTDFARHIDALGKLLQQSHDRIYALSRLRQYQQRRDEQ